MGRRRGRRPARSVHLKVCAVQLAAPDPAAVPHLEALREWLLARLVEARRTGADLLVLPGLAALLPAAVMAGAADPAPDLDALVRRHGAEAADLWLDWCRTYARMLDVNLCAGSGVVLRGGAPVHAAWLVDRRGRVVVEQVQTHVGPEVRDWGIAPGSELEVAELEGARVGLLVGTDARYPEVGRILALLGAWLWLSPQALPAPHDPWAQRAGCWSQVQGNQVYCVEACLVGRLAGRELAGLSACLAPVELTADGSGLLAAAADSQAGEAVAAELDRGRLRALHHEYPVFRHLNPGLYARHLPRAYAAAGEAVPP